MMNNSIEGQYPPYTPFINNKNILNVDIDIYNLI